MSGAIRYSAPRLARRASSNGRRRCHHDSQWQSAMAGNNKRQLSAPTDRAQHDDVGVVDLASALELCNEVSNSLIDRLQRSQTRLLTGIKHVQNRLWDTAEVLQHIWLVAEVGFVIVGKPWGLCIWEKVSVCLLYTSPSPRDKRQSRMPSSA